VDFQGGVDGIGVTTGGKEKVYLVFYGSQWGSATTSNGITSFSKDPTGEAPYLQKFFQGLGTGNDTTTGSQKWSGVMTQYCQGVATGAQHCPSTNTHHVDDPASFGGNALAGVWADTGSSSPSQSTGHDLGVQAVNAAAHFGNTTAASNRLAQYVVLSPTGTHPDGFNTPGGQFCAWHDYNGDTSLSGGAVNSPYGDIAFTNEPYVTDAGSSCGQNFVNSGSAGVDDGDSIVNGHEYAETVTDQNPTGGWIESSGGEEVGDLCAWKSPGTAGASFNLHLGTGTFAVQTIWSNSNNHGNGGCSGNHAVITKGL
jgi:hypothetical protein